MPETSEKKESLWVLIASPMIWTAHFLLSYIFAAVWCAKMGGDGSFTTVRLFIAVLTVASLIGIVLFGWGGYRRFTYGGSTVQDRDRPEDRHRFLGFSALLLSGLSAVAVLYEGLVVFFFQRCY